MNVDLVVIGSGPGGYVAALRGAQLGMKVVVVERESLGGICLNWGCIPTKALLRSADVYRTFKDASSYGLSAEGVSFDSKALFKRSREVAKKLSSGVRFLLKKNAVTVLEGHGCLAGSEGGKHCVRVADRVVRAPHVILATGAHARSLPGLETDGRLIWSYREALMPDMWPSSLLIVGAGAIGVEFASFFNTFGVEVTLVEVQDRLLPVEDLDVSAFVRKSLEAQGIRVMTGARLDKVERRDNSLVVSLAAEGKAVSQEVDRLLAATGIVGHVDNLGLEGTRVVVDKTHIVVDPWCQTGEPGVYALGDVAGPPWLAHKASHEAVLCVEKIAGLTPEPLQTSRVPGCTYSHPQVASLGLTEEEARSTGRSLKVGRFPFQGNGKAIALGEPHGFIKTIFDATSGELLGAHMVGADVTELIQGFGLAQTLEATEEEILHTVFPHPTLSEMMHESVLAAYGRALHT